LYRRGTRACTLGTKNLAERKKTQVKCQDIPNSGIGRLHIVKVATFPKLIYTFNTILVKISAVFLQKWISLFQNPCVTLRDQDKSKKES
jgi:hypothetical protein